MSGESYVRIASAAEFAERFPAKPHGYEGPGLYNKRTGYMMDMPQRTELCAPAVIKDLPEHQHVTGKWISSRSTQRDENKRAGVVPWEPVTKGGRYSRFGKPNLVNEKFARKRGLKTSERSQADLHDAIARKREGLKLPTLNGIPVNKLKFESKGRST